MLLRSSVWRCDERSNRHVKIRFVWLSVLLALTFFFVSSASKVVAQSTCGSTVTVMAGDTLATIVQRCRIREEALLRANPTLDPGQLRVGQILDIPTEPTTESNANADVPIIYVVQPGDWLSRIADRFNVSLNALLAANPQISNPDIIHAGQELVIPQSGNPSNPTVAIAPTSGPPGTRVQVTANGLPPNRAIDIGAGPVASEYDIIATARSDAQGNLRRTVAIPERVGVGEHWVIALTPTDSPADYISNPFFVTQADDNSQDRLTSTNIYLVALEDEGRFGMQIGCGDSVVPVVVPVVVVPVEVQIEPMLGVLRAAMESLVNLDERFYGQSGLYNALHRSNLQVGEITINNGTATIQLSGQISIGGVCDAPRFKNQLRQTALQFYTVDNVQIFINGEALNSVVQ